jgi:hypothetical protein
MKVAGGGGAGRIGVPEKAGLGGFGDAEEGAAVLEHAGVDGEELVDRRTGAEEGGEVEAQGTDALFHAVLQEADGVEGAAVGSAEGEEGAGDLPATETFDEVAGHEAAHRMADQHEAGVGGPRACAPGREPVAGQGLQAACGDPVVAAPVVGEGEVVVAGFEAELVHEVAFEAGVAVELHQAGDDRDVGDQAGGGDAVVGLGIGGIEGKAFDRASEGREGAPEGAGGGTPNLLAGGIGQHAAGDAGQEDDEVTKAGHADRGFG